MSNEIWPKTPKYSKGYSDKKPACFYNRTEHAPHPTGKVRRVLRTHGPGKRRPWNPRCFPEEEERSKNENALINLRKTIKTNGKAKVSIREDSQAYPRALKSAQERPRAARSVQERPRGAWERPDLERPDWERPD